MISLKSSDKIILIVGDSLSYPYGIKPKDSWVKLLQQRIDEGKYPYTIVNYSIPGDKAINAVQRFSWAMKEFKPVITLLELGANDGLYQEPIEKIKASLLQMIIQAKKANSKVILMGMRLGIRLPLQYDPVYRKAFANIYPTLASQEKIILVPLLLKNVDNIQGLMQNDKLHPITQAQSIIADTVWVKLKPLLLNNS